MKKKASKATVKTNEEYISAKDLEQIKQTKERVHQLLAEAQKAHYEAKIADLEFRTLVQHIFIKYNMKVSDRIDDNTGLIDRVPEETPEERDETK